MIHVAKSFDVIRFPPSRVRQFLARLEMAYLTLLTTALRHSRSILPMPVILYQDGQYIFSSQTFLRGLIYEINCDVLAYSQTHTLMTPSVDDFGERTTTYSFHFYHCTSGPLILSRYISATTEAENEKALSSVS
ncbi:hypothetical protein QCA50_008288 [Cerrena zonata]|uniref:Uncharacterized protein n=1 Tax=Cerrena zonata TaxID=2478898 RepID=A0AAW0GFR1_9APHY